MYSRFAWGLRNFLGPTVSVDEAVGVVRRGLEQREERFLRLVERAVFGRVDSPYRRLLQLAGCEHGDLRALVAAHGLEGALAVIRDAGVYVTLEELKGRVPIVRGGQEIAAQAGDFDNPFLRHAWRTFSSGSSGPPAPAWLDLDHLATQTNHWLLMSQAHGLLGAPTALWLPAPPAATGVINILRRTRAGNPPQRWFVPLPPGEAGTARHRLATSGIVLLGRALGSALPRPELVRLEHAVTVARWAARAAATHGLGAVNTTVSQALRVSLAAQDAGISLEGVVFEVGGEPSTPTKVRMIRQAGARHVPRYASVEAGVMGLGCARPSDEGDYHLLQDVVALIPRAREVPWGGEIGVFCFTSLLPSTPKILLNVESDDFGIVERRDCGCPLGSLGYGVHLRRIQSAQKLTGEGMTLAGADMVRILEEVLPARFGGSALDYQLHEEEDARGFTRLVLLVSPGLELEDDAALVATILAELRATGPGEELAAAMWRQAGTLLVRRAPPVWTHTGKLAAVRTGRQGELAR